MGTRTSGKLREQLLQAIDDVVAGKLEAVKAREIRGFANAVSESMKAEVAVSKATVASGGSALPFGQLPIGDTEP